MYLCVDCRYKYRIEQAVRGREGERARRPEMAAWGRKLLELGHVRRRGRAVQGRLWGPTHVCEQPGWTANAQYGWFTKIKRKQKYTGGWKRLNRGPKESEGPSLSSEYTLLLID